MTRAELMKFHEEACGKMRAILAAKNADYAGDAGSPFSNFKNVETLGVCSVEQGFLTRMTDKLSRLASLLKPRATEAKVKDESVTDTLLDLANYCILLAAYIEDEKPLPPLVSLKVVPGHSGYGAYDNTKVWEKRCP